MLQEESKAHHQNKYIKLQHLRAVLSSQIVQLITFASKTSRTLRNATTQLD